MTEEKIRLLEFIFKYFALAIAGIWTLLVGSDFIDKKVKETNLSKAQYELESMRLGKEGLTPRASTSLDVKKDNEHWIGRSDLCTVTGNYKIENVGEYIIRIDEIQLELFEAYPLTIEDLTSDKKVSSFSLTPKLKKLKSIFSEKIEVNETIPSGGYINRTFGWVVKIDSEALYTIRANATGGLAGAKNSLVEISEFYQNDLRHDSGVHKLCKKI